MFFVPLFLYWGSFLDTLACFLVQNTPHDWHFFSCSKCKTAWPWYDRIPLISWVLRKGVCRFCTHQISAFKPFIELITALLLYFLYLYIPLFYFPSYFLFFSALIVTIRSDIEWMLISRFATLFLIPVGLLLSSLKLLPVPVSASFFGTIFGYIFLYSIASFFFWITKKEGIGQGDFELLAFIGSFSGILGVWFSLMIGSIVGSLAGILFICITGKSSHVKIPFGPFLSLGAICYIFIEQTNALPILLTKFIL